jgi:hypothetical protein
MRSFPGKGLIIVLLMLCCTPSLRGQEARDTILWNDWNFRVSPYFWFVGLKGDIYRPPVPGNPIEPPPPKYGVDVGFKDIRNSIKFALMLAGQYRGERIVAQFNFSSLILESEAITPLELLLQDNIINLSYFGGDLEAGYRVVRNPKFEVDALAGLKFIYFGIDLSTDIAGSVEVEGARQKGWIDPTVAVNLRYYPFRKVSFIGYGDIGIPGVGSDFSSQFFTMVQYHFTKTFFTSLGYRSYFIKIPEDEAIFSGQLQGWIARLGFQF